MAVLLILTTILIIIISIWYAFSYKYYRFLKNIPGPPSLPIVGTIMSSRNIFDYLKDSEVLHAKYGPLIKFQIGLLPPLLQTTDQALIEVLLGTTKVLNKGYEYKFIRRWLGNGLLTSGPEIWKHHRKILTPAFHFQMLEKFIDTFDEYSDILIENLSTHRGEQSVDIYPLVNLCTLDVLCATSMGTKLNAQRNATSEYVKQVKLLSKVVMDRSVSFWGVSDFLYSLTSGYPQQEHTVKFLHDHSYSVIFAREKELLKTEKLSELDENEIGIKKRNTFLDTLIKYKLNGGTITNEEIREQVDTFMFAGHDTTSAATSFTLYSLANHPDIQQKVVDELYGIFGDDNRPATSSDLHEMKYLEMVIKESLRLYPPVPLYSRTVTEDTELNGVLYPKGVSITIFTFGVHRNPKVYPDPEKFFPERFTQENQAKRSPYAFIPFSAGPRNCIGQKFAFMEMKIVISKVLRNFELLPAIPEHRLGLQSDLTLVSNTGIKVHLKERKWSK